MAAHSKIIESAEALERFTERATRLSKAAVIRDGLHFDFDIRFDVFNFYAFTDIKERGINEEHLRSFLLLLRPFLSPRDPIHINRISLLSKLSFEN